MSKFQEKIREIAGRFRVRDLYVFGSRADEIAKVVQGRREGIEPSPSDADFGVRFQPGAPPDVQATVRLTQALEDLFGAQRADLVDLAEAPAVVALEVIRGELLYTSDPLAQAEHELFVLRRAADLAPFRRDHVRQILRDGAR